jgi:hypothetical protein
MKTHALSLLRTKNLRYAVLRFQDFQRLKIASKMCRVTAIRYRVS